MPLDPHAKRFLDMLSIVGMTDVAQVSPSKMRENFRRLMQVAGRADVSIGAVTDGELPGPAGALPYRMYRPAGARGEPLPCLVFFHGGGGVFGSIETHDIFCRLLAAASGCAIVSAGYRLGPEHRFPAALDDAVAATEFVSASASRLQIDPYRLAVGGDSAGGNLAASVCHEAKRKGGPAIALQVLFCPVTDLGGDTLSRRAFASGYFLDRATIDWFIGHFCSPADLYNPRLAPLRATDFSNLPPAHIYTAEFDPLRDEGQAYADRLRAAGVPVAYTCHAGMIHHFYGMTAVIPYARTAIQSAGAAIRQALA